MVRLNSNVIITLFVCILAASVATAERPEHFYRDDPGGTPIHIKSVHDPGQRVFQGNPTSQPLVFDDLDHGTSPSSKAMVVAVNRYSQGRRSIPDSPQASELIPSSQINVRFQDIGQTLELSESDIELGLGNLLIGKIYAPDIDVNYYLIELDRISSEIQSRIGRSKDPRKIINAINSYLFGHYGLRAIDEPYTEDFLLHELLDTKRGRCMSLVALYIAIAERIGFHLESICLPEHIFVRWAPARKRRFLFFLRRPRINIETTLKGISLPDKHYKEIAANADTKGTNAFYLKSLTKRETLATYLSPLGNALREKGRIDDAIQACKLSISINQDDAEAWNNLGLAYRRKGHLDMARFAYRRALNAYPNFAEAWQNLGTVQKDDDKRIEYFKKAIAIKPGLEIAWRNLVLAYYETGYYELAWACVNQCRTLGHDLPAPLVRELQYRVQLSSQ